ncbi:MAG: hypothetical protein IKM94_03230 [Alphaproteobacteria bacterium]|nr:hypothetical protein [Alphaproteobacteria bacterium]
MAEVQINLETFLRAYMDYAKLWPAMGENRYKDFWMETVKYYLDGKDNDVAFGLSLDGAPKSVLDVIEEMKRARGSSRVAEIKNTVRFVAEEVFYPVYDGGSVSYDNVPQLQMFLKRLSEFNDKGLVYDALVKLKNTVGYKRANASWGQLEQKRKIVCNNIVNMMASNPNATQKDIVELIYWAKTPDEVLKVINDVFAKTDDDLDKEMKKDVPNSATVNDIIYYPKQVIDIAFGGYDASPELKEYFERFREQNNRVVKNPEEVKKYHEFVAKLSEFRKIVGNKYNFDKIVGSGDRNYVSNYEDTMDKENIDLINRNTTLEQEKGALEKSRDQFRDNYDREKLLNKKMEQRYNDERAARLSVEKMLQNALKVIEAYERGNQEIDKAGVFNKAAAKLKMKEEVEKANDELKRAKAEDAKRKAALVARQTAMGEAISI